ncbi:MAG: RNA-binding domain-containing protein [Asgard group archaeon]|nr:RNA-binding domain-containing protein [Asgard group archaeon]
MSSIHDRCKLKDITYFVSIHATESKDKVLLALRNLFPEEIRDEIEIKEKRNIGHAGNPIIVAQCTITKKALTRKIMSYYQQKMTASDKEWLNRKFEIRTSEDNCLYLRFDKQKAYHDEIALAVDDNTIIVVMKFIIYKDEPGLLKKTIESFGLI